MSLWSDVVRAVTPPSVQERMTQLAEAASEQYEAHPGLPEALRRAAHRATRRFAVEELGVPANPRYPTVFDFFDDYLRPAYQVHSHQQATTWCSRWWDHGSVVFRVRAMWRAYEYLAVTDPMRCDEVFLRTIGDHHMRFLLSPESSPMANCRTEHTPSSYLRSEPMEDSHDHYATRP